MKIVFRADASTIVGTGHVVRCLALAVAARAAGWHAEFVCRAHPGHMAHLIRAQGFAVHLLPAPLEAATIAAGDSLRLGWAFRSSRMQ